MISISAMAWRLSRALAAATSDLCFICPSDRVASEVAAVYGVFDPQADMVFFPAWDCLPYDTVPPSKGCMGRRMDALRVWARGSQKPRLMITSLEALIQRTPPIADVARASFVARTGQTFDRQTALQFLVANGYVIEELVDMPGEAAVRDEVVDLFPAGLPDPYRLYLVDGRISEIWSFDPADQRTETSVASIEFGPASEIIRSSHSVDDVVDPGVVTERALLENYGSLSTLFDVVEGATLVFTGSVDRRLEDYFSFIEEAREIRLGPDATAEAAKTLYLDGAEYEARIAAFQTVVLDQDNVDALQHFGRAAGSRTAFAEFLRTNVEAGYKIVLSERNDAVATALTRRVERVLGGAVPHLPGWPEVMAAPAFGVIATASAVGNGFVDHRHRLAVVSGADVWSETAAEIDPTIVQTVFSEPEMRVGDIVVHEDYGVGILRSVERIDIAGISRDAVRLSYHGDASVLVPVEDFGKLSRYGSDGSTVALDRLHTEAWAKKRLAAENDVRTAARCLLKAARSRRDIQAAVLKPPADRYGRFAARFPYQETGDQNAAIEAVLSDLAAGVAMNRLVCGDVGFGKTEVALRAAAAVVLSGKQVVVLAPTTVLARQHFITFQRRFEGTGIEVATLSRLVTPAERTRTKRAIREGQVRIVVSTQAILAKDVAFDDLGLAVIDEEHRFGTRDKARIAALAPALHLLSMSATPIPRTLQAALVGVQEVSTIVTPPVQRRPVRTSLAAIDEASLKIALMREKRRNGQSFFVVPRIEDMAEMTALLGRLVPELQVVTAHGKMPAAAMEQAMTRFAEAEADVLLSTDIIENGLDIPRANTIFIWRADLFGMAQLHQLRGRVGRSRAQGLAYLLVPDISALAEQTRERLVSVTEMDRLGSGFAVSARDLDLRGSGDLAGEEQSGHMRMIGMSLYRRLLQQAVQRLRRQSQPAAHGVQLSLGVSGSIPDSYVADPSVRLNLYVRLFNLETAIEIDDFRDELEDRFGDLPEETERLLTLERLKVAARRFDISKIEGGPQGLALSFSRAPNARTVKVLTQGHDSKTGEDRIVLRTVTDSGLERLNLMRTLLDKPVRADRQAARPT